MAALAAPSDRTKHPTAKGAARFLVAERRRLSGPGLRTFDVIADLWGLTEAERLSVLGHPSRSTYYSWLKAARAHADIALSADTLTRISAVLGIHKALKILFPTEPEEVAWLRGPHEGAVFGGRPPLSLVTCGTQDGLLTVRRFLDAARGGTYMEPNAADDGFRPYSDHDVVFV